MADELTFYDYEEPMRDSAFGLIKEGGEQLRLLKFGMTLPMTFKSFAVEVAERRPGHSVVTDKSDDWLRERDAFVEKYEALTKEGVDSGFLDYEYEGTVVPTTNTQDVKWVYDDEQDNEEKEK